MKKFCKNCGASNFQRLGEDLFPHDVIFYYCGRCNTVYIIEKQQVKIIVAYELYEKLKTELAEEEQQRNKMQRLRTGGICPSLSCHFR